MRYNLFALFLLIASVSGYAVDLQVRRGDLIFQASAASEFSKAINAAARQNHDSLTFCHVGIIDVDDDNTAFVIEAEPKNGVRRVSLNQFLAESDSLNGEPLVVVKRLNVPFSPDSVIATAMSFIGQEYDHAFIHDNGKMYCSELVYESYFDADGNHIFNAIPMNFRDSEGNMPQFWIEKYGKMGIPIPEGKPGTHPDTLSRDSRLTTISSGNL